MTPLLLALLVFAIAGGAATLWLRQHGSPADAAANARERDESQLAELRWRDFTRLVLQAMKGRGYEPVIEDGMSPDGIPSDGGDILLERDGHYVLLSCKYGSGSVVGVQAILGLGKSATLRGAESVIVATPGKFETEAMRVARQQGNIELLDGKDLWPELRPYVARTPAGTPAPAAVAAAPMPQRAVAIAWGGAAALAVVAWMFAQGMQSDAPANEAGTPPATAARVPASDARDATPAAAAAVAIENNVVPTDPAALERRRRETANAISTLFGVDRALWSTQSTLLVYLAAEEADPSGELCPLLERYPELAASRVQLQPPQGSQKPVRFKQCRSY